MAGDRRRQLLRVSADLLGIAARELRAGPAATAELSLLLLLTVLPCDSEAELAEQLCGMVFGMFTVPVAAIPESVSASAAGTAVPSKLVPE